MTSVMFMVFLGGLIPILPERYRHFGVKDEFIPFMFAGFLIPYIIANPIVTIFSKKSERSRMATVLLGYLAHSVSLLLLGPGEHIGMNE